MSLTAVISNPDTRNAVIDDAVQLVEDEVAKKKGLGGMVIKTGFKAVKGIKPGFIRKVVDSLLDRWTESLQPLWNEAQEQGMAPASHLQQERGRVAEALLAVTDEKAKNAQHGVVASTYNKLRPSAKKHVEEAVPGLIAILGKHTR